MSKPTDRPKSGDSFQLKNIAEHLGTDQIDERSQSLADTAFPEEFTKIVEARRSVRVYDSTPIPESVVREALRLALLAPNSSNLQPWEFYWVRTPAKRDALVRACMSQPAAATAAELFVAVARIDTWRRNRKLMLTLFEEQSKTRRVPKGAWVYYRKLVPLMYEQGWLSSLGLIKRISLWIMGWFTTIPREPTSKSQLKLWASKSTALACENFMLAMRAHGFDTCPMEGLDSARVKKLLGVPRSSTIVMAISAGKRDSKGIYGPQVRFKPELFLKEV